MIEVEIFVRHRDVNGKIVGSCGHEKVQINFVGGGFGLPLKDRKTVALRLAVLADGIVKDVAG